VQIKNQTQAYINIEKVGNMCRYKCDSIQFVVHDEESSYIRPSSLRGPVAPLEKQKKKKNTLQSLQMQSLISV